MNIRHATPDDARTIVEAERQIAKEPGLFCSEPSELLNETVVNTILSFREGKKGVYLVAEQEGKIIGHAFLMPHCLKSLAHVASLNIAVHIGWQGKGVGQKLLEEIIEWARKSSLEKIELNVRATNARAIALYKKMGFYEEGRLKNRVKVDGRYFDDVLMGFDLKKT